MSQYKNVGTVRPAVSSYLWEIEDFCIYCKNYGDYLISPVFSTVYSSKEHKWVLHLYPKGAGESSRDCLEIALKYMGESNSYVKVSLSLIDSNYCKIDEFEFARVYIKNIPFGFVNFNQKNFITNNKNRVLVNGTIKVLCEIIHDYRIAFPIKNKCTEENSSNYCRLKEFDEFEKLLEAENSTDVTIKIGNDKIKVHKRIIMSRSPVFQAMFEHDMKEKDQNVVEITDIKYKVMKEVLRFMYVGKVNELEQIAGELLVAADKYAMKGLKVLSEKQLLEDLTVSNAIGYLKLADLCNSNDLKSKIIQFIIRNQKDFIGKPELQQLPVEVVCEVFSAVVSDNLNK